MLLDTHIALWATFDHPRLPHAARAPIEDADNEIFVSVMSLWEIAIKHARSRTSRDAMPVSAAEAEGHFDTAGFKLLDVRRAHVRAMEALPPIHADPFDRMIVAQSSAESLQLLTHNRVVGRYGKTILVV